MDEPLKIVIADSHEIVREGIANRLVADVGADVIGQASDGYTTIKICRHSTPDVLLMDLSLTRPSGVETFAKLRSTVPDMKIIVLSSDATTTDAFSVLGQGAVAFMPKQATGADIVNAVRSAAMGFSCVPADYMHQFVSLRRNVTRSGNIFGLSPREVEVLLACASGAKTKEVAGQLCISARTVETHRNSIYKKTSCRNISELAAIAEQI